MKIKTVLLPIFAIVLFAGVTSAQRVTVFDGSAERVLTSVTPTSGPQSGPNLNAFAGQTVRIRIEAADASTASFIFGFPSSTSVCTEGTLFTRPASGSSPQGKLYLGNDVGVYQLPTDPAWKGGCRILSVRLRDGSEHIGRIFFH